MMPSEFHQSVSEPARLLVEKGTLLYSRAQLPLDEAEWQRLEQLLRQVEYDHVIAGDSSESHSVHVARFVNDVKRPESLHALSGEIRGIVMSEKMRRFYSHFTGSDVLCLRRCQANLLLPGDYIGLHKDQDSNPDYIATVVFHFDDHYEGGDFVTHHPEQGARRYHPVGRSVLVNNCEIPHEVTPLSLGRRRTLACFLSTEFGDSPKSRKDFKLSN